MDYGEDSLLQAIEPHILRCRPGDWGHAQRVVRWVKELGRDREDLPLLITAGYIHDIGWRDLVTNNKITFDQLLSLEPQANRNSEPFIREVLTELKYTEKDIQTILRLVASADEHKSSKEDEAIIVDADSLSKLDINHIKEKYQPSEWMRLYELWEKRLPSQTKTEKAKELFPGLLKQLKEDIKTRE